MLSHNLKMVVLEVTLHLKKMKFIEYNLTLNQGKNVVNKYTQKYYHLPITLTDGARELLQRALTKLLSLH